MFAQQVVGAITNGDGVNMPSPFSLGAAGQILGSASKPQIFISTPNDPAGGGLLFQDRINTVIQSLTGAGAPFAGVPVTTRGYVKPMSDTAATALKYMARGKILIQYDNNQVDDAASPPCQQKAIWRVWLEDQKYEHEWDATEVQIGTGHQKRLAASAACTRPASSGVSTASGSLLGSASSGSLGSSASSSSAGPASTSGGSLTSSVSPSSTSIGSSSGSLTTTSSGSATAITGGASSSASPASVPSSSASMTSTTSSTSSQSSSSGTPAPTFTSMCYPFQDPDAGPAAPQCQCDGLPGKYPFLSSTSGQSSYNPCGYTTSPTIATATSIPPFITTESNGLVVSCASSTYYNYAVNENPTCAGPTQVISTIASLASVYSASSASVAVIESSSASAASAASASASYASAAAVPSAGCWVLSDDGWGDSAFEIYGINGWAGSDGSKLFDQLFGCGIVSGGEFHTDGQDIFDGQKRSTQYAYFGLSFFKGGCVERAVHSAGGPSPGDGNGQLACQQLPSQSLSGDQMAATGTIGGAQLKAVKNVAGGGAPAGSSAGTVHRLAVDTSGTGSKPVAGGSPDAAMVASASAALPHLLAAASATPSG